MLKLHNIHPLGPFMKGGVIIHFSVWARQGGGERFRIVDVCLPFFDILQDPRTMCVPLFHSYVCSYTYVLKYTLITEECRIFVSFKRN